MDQAQTLRQMVTRTLPASDMRVIGVTSGKGGVGKTNLTTNLAVLAAQAKRRVLILDADLGLANVEVMFGITPRYHLGHLLDGSATLDQVITPGPHGISIISAGSGVQSLTKLSDEQRIGILHALDPLEDRFDLVLIDSGAGIGDNVLFFVGAAHEALLVVAPEPTSLSDAYATVKVLSKQAGLEQFNVVINQAADELSARNIFHKLTQVTSRFLTAKVEYVGYVPRDASLQWAVMAQQPVLDLYPRAPSSLAIAQLGKTLLSRPNSQPVDGGMKFFWKRLFRETMNAVG